MRLSDPTASLILALLASPVLSAPAHFQYAHHSNERRDAASALFRRSPQRLNKANSGPTQRHVARSLHDTQAAFASKLHAKRADFAEVDSFLKDLNLGGDHVKVSAKTIPRPTGDSLGHQDATFTRIRLTNSDGEIREVVMRKDPGAAKPVLHPPTVKSNKLAHLPADQAPAVPLRPVVPLNDLPTTDPLKKHNGLTAQKKKALEEEDARTAQADAEHQRQTELAEKAKALAEKDKTRWSNKEKAVVAGGGLLALGGGYELLKHHQASAAAAADAASDGGDDSSACPGQGGDPSQSPLTSSQKSNIQSEVADGAGPYTDWLLICNSPYTPDDWNWVNATVSASPLLSPAANSAFTTIELLQINDDLCNTPSNDNDVGWYTYYNSTVLAYNDGWDGSPGPTSSDLSAINNADCSQVQAAVAALQSGATSTDESDSTDGGDSDGSDGTDPSDTTDDESGSA